MSLAVLACTLWLALTWRVPLRPADIERRLCVRRRRTVIRPALSLLDPGPQRLELRAAVVAAILIEAKRRTAVRAVEIIDGSVRSRFEAKYRIRARNVSVSTTQF